MIWSLSRALQEAQDIFGLDFDYGEFEKFGQEDYSEDEEADEYEEEYSDEEGQPRRRAKKKTSKKTIFDVRHCFINILSTAQGSK
jgi:transcription elongation factor SPT6